MPNAAMPLVSDKGLIELIDAQSIKGITEDLKKAHGFKTTAKGRKAHRVFIDAIYKELLQLHKKTVD